MRSLGSVRALGLAIVAAAALAGCGSEVVAEQEQPVTSPAEQQNYSGLTVYSLRNAGISIGVPSGWDAMTAEDAYGPAVEAIIADKPKLAGFRDVFSQPDSPFKLVAMEYDPVACICSTINVIALPRKQSGSVREFEAGVLAATREHALPGTKPKVKRMKTPAGAGLRVTSRMKLPGTHITVVSTQYVIHAPRFAYILAYTASPDVTKTYGRLFERSAHSLREV
jgi:hypothetical protein